MCGIAGYFGRDPVDEAGLLTCLRHRGPDTRGTWRASLPDDHRLQLLHTRLRIVDLSEASAQPMRLRRNGTAAGPAETVGTGDESDEFVLIFNGEIYNFPSLRAELGGKGHRFRSRGDTEVLLRGYAEWGEAVFSRLDGMFALALYDRARRLLLLARDHAGIKPLYLARTHDGGWLFASEVRAILGTGRCEARIDPVAVADYLRLGSLQEPRTLVAGIRALPPGHVGELRLDEGTPAALVTRPFWAPESIPVETRPDEGAWRRQHRTRLLETVREQLLADVPLGVFLSGGVDSTLLLELAAAADRDRIVAFTLAGRATEFNEGAAAAESARRSGVRHLLVQPGAGEIDAWIGDGLAAMDQPSADGMNTYLISRAARQAGLVVVLSGAGADELHGAYGHARGLARLMRAAAVAGRWRGGLSTLLAGALRVSGRAVMADRAQSLLAAAASSWHLVQERRRFFTPAQVATLWPAGAAQAGGWSPPYGDREAFVACGLREQVRLAEIRGYLLNTLLRDADWATMANQQELRVPFLGRRYMECVLGAAERMTATRGGAKPQLVALLSPEAQRLARLPKRGFTLDYAGWLGGPLAAEFGRAAGVLEDRLGFAIDAPAHLAALRRSRSQKDARRLWALLTLGRYIGAHGLQSAGRTPRSGSTESGERQELDGVR